MRNKTGSCRIGGLTVAIVTVFWLNVAGHFAPLPAQAPTEQLVAESLKAMESADPFMGDWEGQFIRKNKKGSFPIAAQVVALGKGRYHATFMHAFDKRTTTVVSLEGFTSGSGVAFFGWGDISVYCGPDWEGTIRDGKFTGVVSPSAREGGTFELQKVVRLSPTLGVKPPAGAVVLFDGTNFNEWVSYSRVAAVKSAVKSILEGKTKQEKAEKSSAKAAAKTTAARTVPGPVKWVIENGMMKCTPGSGTLSTKRQFLNFRMHLEFRTPFIPTAREQARGNSGVLFHGLEIQVLDSYGLIGRSKECGGIYARVDPLVNMCRPPMQWQTYDVTVETPPNESNARLTVLHNGVPIHDRLDIGPLRQPTNITLQDHGNPIMYRNIWLVDLGPKS
ncbi:MAG: DUF1080 domain-containing protein [Candidatus Sumerlaeia bacterium]|nr:DUF1080 domain-containing protein [Candidatus Sumerlaeia bacterium]